MGSMRSGWRTKGTLTLITATLTGAALLGVVAPAAAQTSAAKTLYVSQGGFDSGSCTAASPCATVSYALTQAASGATIEVSGTIEDDPVISSPVTITTWPGGPAGSPAALDGVNDDTAVTVESSVTGVTLSNLTIENASNNGVVNGGTLTITDSTVSGNTGEGIFNVGTLTITDSTVSGNTGDGGIASHDGTMTIVDSTITKNSNDSDVSAAVENEATMTIIASTISGNTGGGIYSSGTVTLGATIVADNTVAAGTGGNCVAHDAGDLDSAGYNLTNDKTGADCSFTSATDLVNKKPALGPLASNGGPTKTLLPGTTSPAADQIPDLTTLRGVAVCPGTDQRGVARPGPGGTGCTIGAVEAGLKNPTTTSVTLSPATVTAGTRVAYLAVVNPQSGTGTPTGTITFTTGTTTLCTAVLSGGVAACGATNAPAGTDTVTGTYSGGDGYATSSGTAALTVTTG